MTNQTDDVLLWGGRAIGAAININQSKALRFLEQGRIKCAIKRDGLWTAWRNAVRREFGLSDGTLGTDMSWLSRDELQQIGATMDPPEPVSIVHTPTIMQEAKAFADQYAREQPANTASRGGRDAVLRTWWD
jgi:hypothetical protein